MAPEQARSEAVTQRSDVFALGAMLCEILTGAPPFAGDGAGARPFDVLARVRQADLSSALARLDRCGADAELVCLARKCLSPRPDDRPADGVAVAERVGSHLAGLQERLRRAEVGQARAEARAEGERTRRRLAIGLAAAVLAVVALGGAALLLVQRSQAEQAHEQTRRHQAGESALARAAELRQQGRWDEALAVLEPVRQRLDERDVEVGREVRQAMAELELIGRLEGIRLRTSTFTGGSFAWDRADREFESEFRAAGLGGTEEPAEAMAERVRASRVRAGLVAALDAWAMSPEDRRRRAWVRAVARSADQDSDEVRRLRASWDDPAALRVLARKAPIDRLSPHLLNALSFALNDNREAVTLLRKALLRYPGDFWLNFSLALLLKDAEQYAEAVGFYRAALAIRPGTPAVLHNIGDLLTHQGRLDEACDCYLRAIEIDPGFAYAHNNLGHIRRTQGKVDEAVACFRRAIEHDPKFAVAHCNLGLAMEQKGRFVEAIACYREAIAIDSKYANAHNNLGKMLAARGRLDEAVPCFRNAIEHDPKLATAHYNLGLAMAMKGRFDEAIACYREAIKLDPKHQPAHLHLGARLLLKNEMVAASECFREVIALDPKSATAHHMLGAALKGRGQIDEAIASFRKAIALDPSLPWAHSNLGHALMRRGDFIEALAAMKRAHELGSKLASWPSDSAAWVQQCQGLVEREKKLLAVLAGKARAASAGELAEHAGLCVWTKRYAAAVRLWVEAFESEPKLADDLNAGHRYNAACSAALAAAGRGKAGNKAETRDRLALRRRALTWLRADLAARQKQLNGAEADRARAALRHWQRDPDLAGVRDAVALQALSAEERQAWQRLWADIQNLLASVPGKTAAGGSGK
jgi:tetratricopeptide (TPR) repeat protein